MDVYKKTLEQYFLKQNYGLLLGKISTVVSSSTSTKLFILPTYLKLFRSFLFLERFKLHHELLVDLDDASIHHPQ